MIIFPYTYLICARVKSRYIKEWSGHLCWGILMKGYTNLYYSVDDHSLPTGEAMGVDRPDLTFRCGFHASIPKSL